MNVILKTLKKIGLSPNEAKVYLAGLSLGPSLASEIAKKSGIKRSLTYHLINSLLEKGLVSKIGKKHDYRFTMEPPDRLQDFIKRKQNELKRMESQINEVSAELESIYSPKLRPATVRFYEGVEGIKNAAFDSLETKQKIIRGLISPEIFQILDETSIRYWAAERPKRGIQTKAIWTQNIKPPYLKDLPELRLTPAGLDFQNTLIVYDDKVTVFSSGKESFAFVVENESYAKTMKNFFDFLWERSMENKKTDTS